MRLNPEAETHDEAVWYLRDRARQMLHKGWLPCGDLDATPDAVHGMMMHPMYGMHQVIYVFKNSRSKGVFQSLVTAPIVTTPDCGIEYFLRKKKIPYQLATSFVLSSNEYKAVSEFYGDRCAARSQVPLINHIDEGLYVLQEIGANMETMQAYCLHPLCQDDAALASFNPSKFSPRSVMLALEYRNIANLYLSFRPITGLEEIKLSPLEAVNQMLVADKVQNQKDFLLHHYGRHPRSGELQQYFSNWIQRLSLDPVQVERWQRNMNLRLWRCA